MIPPRTESMWQLSEGSQDTTESAVEHTRRISLTYSYKRIEDREEITRHGDPTVCFETMGQGAQQN
jgi:hypothetical protein